MLTDHNNYTVKTSFLRRGYRNDSFLKKRFSIYRYVRPKFDLDKTSKKALGIRGNEAILDIGCGNGEFLKMIRKSGHKGRLVGIDLSKGMIAKAKAGYKKLGLEFYVGDMQKLPFGNSCFDRLLAKHSLTHVESVPKASREIYRVLRNDGMLIATTNSPLTRPKTHKLIDKVSRKFGPRYFRVVARFNTENCKKLLRPFKKVSVRLHRGTIALKLPEPYVLFIDSLRPFYNPRPKDSVWKQALAMAKETAEKEIKSKGMYTETNIVGIIIAKK